MPPIPVRRPPPTNVQIPLPDPPEEPLPPKPPTPREPAAEHDRFWEDASFPDDLIQLLKGLYPPEHLIDATSRFLDPAYLADPLDAVIRAHLGPAALDGASVLDVGCGAGASSLHLARLYPLAEVTGVDRSPAHVAAARLLAVRAGLPRVRFVDSSGVLTLPEGPFDHIVCNAVIEHLLPDERARLVATVWERLAPGGTWIVTESPYRWFPVELHTTGLWGINYLPDDLLARIAPRRGESWQDLQRRGIRGTTLGELRRLLEQQGASARLLPPTRSGCRDRIDLWEHVGSGRPRRKLYGHVARLLRKTTGRTLVPQVSGAFRKPAR